MDPATDRFIELATRPLADNAELHLAAASELRRRIGENSASPEKIAEAVDVLARADQRPKRRYWRIALYLTTLLVSVPMLVQTVVQANRYKAIARAISGISTMGSSPAPLSQMLPGLPMKQKLLLFGDESAADSSSQWKPLWESEPDNPAFLAQYAAAYFNDHKELSGEILATAARIDPDNGWYPALAASGLAERAVVKESTSSWSRKTPKAPQWKIIDEEALTEALALIHQAARKPRLTAYEEELLRQRIPWLPPRRDFVSQVPRMSYVASRISATIPVRKTVDALGAGARQCAANQDVEGFRRIVDDWQALAKTATRDGDTFLNLLIAKAIRTAPAESFRDAAQDLGLDGEARRFDKIHQDTLAEKEVRKRGRRSSENMLLLETRGSIFAGLTLPVVESQIHSPPRLTDADLRPSRYAEHALIARGIAWLSWIVLGVGAGLAFLHRSRMPMMTRSLSERMLDLLRPSDWLWTLGGGILVPLLWGGLFYYFTPLSARDWSVRPSGFLLPAVQLGSVTVLMLVSSAVIASSRLERRAGFLWSKSPRRIPGMLAVACAALAIPLVGTLSLLPRGFGNQTFMAGCAMAALAALWLLAGLFVYLLDKPIAGSLRRATLARIAFPAWIFGMLAMAVSVPFHYAEECRWTQQDRLLEITADAPSLSRYEWEVTQILRRELLETMSLHPGGAGVEPSGDLPAAEGKAR